MDDIGFNMIAGLLLGYLLGSIPFGLLLTKASGGGDIRNIGSGNIGATNVLRTGRKGLAALTLLLDLLKGFRRSLYRHALSAGWCSVCGCRRFLRAFVPRVAGFQRR